MTVTFFGHSDINKDVLPILSSTIIDLIENQKADEFYVGNNGKFDFAVRRTLEEVSKHYPINYSIVLAYLPEKESEYEDYSNTIYPEGIETVPKRFAISWRNKWMIKQADTVVTYVTRSYGGAAKFKLEAEKNGKKIIELSSIK